MKISSNPIELNTLSQIGHPLKHTHHHKTLTTKIAIQSDSTEMIPKDSQYLFNLNSLQKKYANSQNIQGLLSKIKIEIKDFHQKPDMYQKSIQQVANTLQKTYPKFAQRLRQVENNPMRLSNEIQSISKEIAQISKSQKKEITQYLVKEQNKDALNHIAITQQDISKLNQHIKSSHTSEIHNPSADLITKLLI